MVASRLRGESLGHIPIWKVDSVTLTGLMRICAVCKVENEYFFCPG